MLWMLCYGHDIIRIKTMMKIVESMWHHLSTLLVCLTVSEYACPRLWALPWGRDWKEVVVLSHRLFLWPKGSTWTQRTTLPRLCQQTTKQSWQRWKEKRNWIWTRMKNRLANSQPTKAQGRLRILHNPLRKAFFTCETAWDGRWRRKQKCYGGCGWSKCTGKR